VLNRRPVHNLVISNVPGPQVPLYFLGCQVNAMYPLGPIFYGTGLNITVMSLTGKLDVGINSCWELVPTYGIWPTTSRSPCRNCSPPPRDPPEYQLDGLGGHP